MINILLWSIIILLIFIFSIILSIYLVKINYFDRKNKITITDIIKTLETDITTIFENFFFVEMVKTATVKQSILETEDLKVLCKDVYSMFLKIYNKNELQEYNKITNGNIDVIILKIIHSKLFHTNLQLKKSALTRRIVNGNTNQETTII